MYAMEQISSKKPIELDFSEEFTRSEIDIVKLLKHTPVEKIDCSAIAQIITAYSKFQIGSVEFASALENYILEFAHDGRFKSKELASVLYSYSMAAKWDKSIIESLKPTAIKHIQNSSHKDVR